MNIKKIFLLLSSKLAYKVAPLCFFGKIHFSQDNANQILKESGYVFLPLWDKIPQLNNSKLDLSIVIPIYNSEIFLPSCLDSILNQITEYKYEVICINDGSIDHSKDILRQYQNNYPGKLIVYEQENQGISAARNKGIELSTGKYVGFIDNDDTVSEDYIDTLMKKASETDADIIQCGYTYQTVDGTVLTTEIKKEQTIISSEKERLFNNVQGYIWGGCIKSSLFKSVRFPIGYWYEDMVTRMLLMPLAQKVAIIEKALYHKTIHQTNASKVLWKKQDIKAVDQFFLAKQFADYSQNVLNIPANDLLFNTLITEWSRFLWIRTKGLPKQIRKSVFNLAADYLNNFQIINTYNKALSLTAKAFHNRNFLQWQVISLAMLLEAKAKEI